MPKKALSYVLSFLLLVFAFFSWNSIDNAVLNDGASDFWIPLLWISFLVITLGLSMFLIREKYFLVVIFFLVFFLDFIFVHSLFFFPSIFAGTALFYYSYLMIQSDMAFSLKISIRRSFRRGIYAIILALSVVISSQYFFSISDMPMEKLIPKFKSNRYSDQLVSFIISKISPDLKNFKSDELIVDDFLNEIFNVMLKKQIGEEVDIVGDDNSREVGTLIQSQAKETISSQEKELVQVFMQNEKNQISELSDQAKKSAIEKWKAQLSDLAGSEISGNEKVSELFLSILNNRISNISDSAVRNSKSSEIFPMILALALFFSIVPIGSLVSRIWFLFAAAIFAILKKIGIVKIVYETKEVERIE